MSSLRNCNCCACTGVLLVYWNVHILNNIEGVPFVSVDKTFTFCSSLSSVVCGVNELVGTAVRWLHHLLMASL